MTVPVKLIIEDFLTTEERNSLVWQSVLGHIERLLAKRRIENDNPELTDVETATLRGHIECLKSIRDLGRTPPPMTAPAARPGPRPDYGAKYG